MSGPNIRIDRLIVELFGMPTSLGEDFAGALGSRIEKRLQEGSIPGSDRRISSLSLARIDVDPESLDADALATVVADRLIGSLAEENDKGRARGR